MSLKQTFLFIVLVHMFSVSYAQQSKVYTSRLIRYQKALALYNNSQYLASQTMFKAIKGSTNDVTLKSDCDYYIANNAVRLNQQNADKLMQDFVTNYPTSTKRNTAFLDVADYYFNNGKYAYAKKWYDRVEESGVSGAEKERFYFNRGYAAFTTKKYKQAKTYLSRVEDSKKYGSQAKYYIGFMAYQGNDYNQANTYFEQVNDQEKYKEKLSYYQADLNFKLGRFEKAITLASKQLAKKNSPAESSELNKIVGESYFNLKKYEEAIPFLKAYKGKRGKWNNTDYYQLGYAYYKQKEYNPAISEFNKIINGANNIAQNAYYHLGESYVHLGKKQEGLNAFRNASQMDFDLKIKEDAWLNYAKLSYDVGNPYQPVPHVLSEYLDNYPNSKENETIETLLIDSYISSKNYKDALTLLKGKQKPVYKLAYQKVAFFRGIELYNETKYNAALTLFEASLKRSGDLKFEARATFWKAEALYHLLRFEEALGAYSKYNQLTVSPSTPEFLNLNYNLAYTYFKLKKYNLASTHFNAFLNTSGIDTFRKKDAYLRLGDTYFVTSRYDNAINAYTKVIEQKNTVSDYAAFQSAMCYGYLGQTSKKNQYLLSFLNTYPKSKFNDDALFILGNDYVKNNNIKQAMLSYDKLQNQYPKSPLIAKAMLRQGLVQYNNNNNQLALKKLKAVAAKFPSTPEANQAVATARLIYIDLGQVEAYANWVKTLNYVAVTDADLDAATYQAAEKQYLDQNTKVAKAQFIKYLKQFPNGIHALQAHFYLAQLQFNDSDKQDAKLHYERVILAAQNEFTEEALLKIAQIFLEEKQWVKAINYLKQLETLSNFSQSTVFAQSNIMNAAYQLKQYKEAEIYAEKALNHENLDVKIKNDAHIIIARSALKTNNEAKAKKAYALVEQLATGQTKAEAMYYNAYFKNKENAYQASNKVVQNLVKNLSTYKYYVAKSLVVMAKNFYVLQDAFQATYILENVIKNSKEFTEITNEATQLLNTIKAEQAKTNASVPEGN